MLEQVHHQYHKIPVGEVNVSETKRLLPIKKNNSHYDTDSLFCFFFFPLENAANSQTFPSSSNINNSSIQTLIVKSGNIDGNNFLKSPPPQYSSLHQTQRQIRTTQNAFVSSSNNSVSNNCDSNSLNEISTTVTSQTGVSATIDSAEGELTLFLSSFSYRVSLYKHQPNFHFFFFQSKIKLKFH